MEEFYYNQAGSGISTYSGLRYQKGHGFFGRFIKGGVIPLFKKIFPYLGKQAIETGTDLFTNLNSGSNFKEAASKTLKKRAGAMSDDAVVHLKRKLQGGEGVRRKRRRRAAPKSIKGRRSTKRKTTTRRRVKAPTRRAKVENFLY